MHNSDAQPIPAAVAAYFEAIRSRDEAGWLALFADDAVSHDPVGSPPTEGELARREIWKMLTAPFERLELKEDQVFVCGSGAAVKWTGMATGVNDRKVRFEGISVFEVGEDGKIQTLMSYWDPGAMMLDLAGEDG